MCAKKVHTHQDDEVRYVLLQQNKVTIIISKTFCFGQVLEKKREHGQTKLD
jgi:cupin superfamily acireductone dioxygenase involved in methionine salvage